MVRYCLGIFVLVAFGCLAISPTCATTLELRNVRPPQAYDVPLVSLKTWKDSTEQERYSFLAGFVTMLELERQWQGQNPLPLKQSLVQSWSRGFEGMTLKQIHDSLGEYITANPKDLERQVVEVLWFKFAQPKVTERLDSSVEGPEQKKR